MKCEDTIIARNKLQGHRKWRVHVFEGSKINEYESGSIGE